MISEEMYNNMLENMHLTAKESNYRWLLESAGQLKRGNEQIHDLIGMAEDEE